MKILIIGAGAAGMMAAATIAESDCGAEICLVDKNSILGRKVIISGGGRCNLTTAENDINRLMRAYPRGSRWLRYPMHEFPPSEVYKWFEKQGIPLKTEGQKIFPQSNQGTDVTAMFQKIFKKHKVEVLLKKAVKKVAKVRESFHITFEDETVLNCDKLIITTGGSAYRHTGSSGDGYAFAESLGHNIKPLAATLNSYAVTEPWISDLAGVSIKTAKFKLSGKEKHEFSGPFIFTHKGVSGPGIFALSSLAAFEECSDQSPLSLNIDFVPDMSYQSLSEKISQNIKTNLQSSFLKLLTPLLPKSLLRVILSELKVDGSKPVREIAKKDISRTIESLKNFKMTLREKTAGSEIVTAGGIDLMEVDQKTMESKICPGLYFGGELLDVDGFTGGYNLQIAWATGRLAGLSVQRV